MYLFFTPKAVGKKNIPKRGAVIFASNHLSVVDSIVLPLVVRRQVYFLAKAEYFRTKGFIGRFVTWFMKSVGQIKMDRSGGTASESSLQNGLKILKKGGCLGIYPEGTRSADGRLYRGRVGVARLILSCNFPVSVVPVAMHGTDKILPIGSKYPRKKRCKVVFGKPIVFTQYSALVQDRFTMRAITDCIMLGILQISSQEYVDEYSPKKVYV